MQYKNHVTMILAAVCFVLVAGTTVEIIGALPSNTGMAVTLGSEVGLMDQFTNYCEPVDAADESCDDTCGDNICIPIFEMCDDPEPTQCYCCEVKK